MVMKMDPNEALAILIKNRDKNRSVIYKTTSKYFKLMWDELAPQLKAAKKTDKEKDFLQHELKMTLENQIWEEITYKFLDHLWDLFFSKDEYIYIPMIANGYAFGHGKEMEFKRPLGEQTIKQVLKWIIKIYETEFYNNIIESKYEMINKLVNINTLTATKRLNQIGNRLLKEDDPNLLMYKDIWELVKKKNSVYKSCKIIARKHPELEGADETNKEQRLRNRYSLYFRKHPEQFK